MVAAVMPILLASTLALALAAPTGGAGEGGRGLSVVRRDPRQPVLGVAASLRLGVLIGNGAAVIQPPLGFGFGLDVRYHALAIGGARLGLGFHAGHDRFADRRTFTVAGEDGEPVAVVRPVLLNHTDMSLGPSLQIPLRVLFLELGGGGGLAVSSLRRAVSAAPRDDEQTVGYDPLIRGEAALAIPIVRDQGLRIGAAVHKIFSRKRIELAPAETPTAVFDLILDVSIAYQAWF
jgi:hypothetical protein